MREGKSTRAREEVSLRDAPAFKKINMEIKTKQMYQSILSVIFFIFATYCSNAQNNNCMLRTIDSQESSVFVPHKRR